MTLVKGMLFSKKERKTEEEIVKQLKDMSYGKITIQRQLEPNQRQVKA